VTIDSERKTDEKGSENTYMPRRIASASTAASVLQSAQLMRSILSSTNILTVCG
jgi:hypothetical protein